MIRNLMLLIISLTGLTGCTSTQLKNSTLNQARTLTDLQYTQVLNNLALICANAEALPSVVNVKDGSAQIADLGSASYMGDWHKAFKSHPTLLGSRTVVEQWGMNPVTNDNELQLLQLAFQRAAGIDTSLESDHKFANDLAHDIAKQLPDIDDYRGVIISQFEDFKNMRRELPRPGVPGQYQPPNLAPGYPALPPGPDFRDMLRYLYTSHDREAFNRQTISTIDQLLIYENELIQCLEPNAYYDSILETRAGKEYYISKEDYISNKYVQSITGLLKENKKYDFDGYPRLDCDSGGVHVSERQVNYVTPEAAVARRTIREIEADLLEIPTDRRWYGRGCHRDIPDDACYVGSHGDLYVWVCPAGLKELSRLTLKSLKFTDVIKDDSVLTVPGPRFTPSSAFGSP